MEIEFQPPKHPGNATRRVYILRMHIVTINPIEVQIELVSGPVA